MSKEKMAHADVQKLMEDTHEQPAFMYMMALGLTMVLIDGVSGTMGRLINKHKDISEKLKLIDKIEDEETRKKELEKVRVLMEEFADYVEKQKPSIEKYINVIDLNSKDDDE